MWRFFWGQGKNPFINRGVLFMKNYKNEMRKQIIKERIQIVVEKAMLNEILGYEKFNIDEEIDKINSILCRYVGKNHQEVSQEDLIFPMTFHSK